MLHTINQGAVPHLVLLTFIVEDFSAIQRTQIPLQGLVQVVATGSSQDSSPLQELRSKSSCLTGRRLLRPSLKAASGGPSPPTQTHPNISGPTYTQARTPDPSTRKTVKEREHSQPLSLASLRQMIWVQALGRRLLYSKRKVN